MSLVMHQNQFGIVNFSLDLYCVRHFLFVKLDILIKKVVTEYVVICLWHINSFGEEKKEDRKKDTNKNKGEHSIYW